MGPRRSFALLRMTNAASLTSSTRMSLSPARTRLALSFFAITIAVGAPATAQTPPYDILLIGGTVIDGSGAPGVRADVAIQGNRIARVSASPLARNSARRVIDATNRVIAPGFIDLHAHLDPLLRLPGAESHVRQGVTTALGGPDGGAPFPLRPYLDTAKARGLGMNVAFLAGHNTIRERVLGMADRAPTAAELSRMKAMVAQAMSEGAF